MTSSWRHHISEFFFTAEYAYSAQGLNMKKSVKRSLDIISSDRCQKVKLKKKWPFLMRSFLWLSLVDSYGPIILGLSGFIYSIWDPDEFSKWCRLSDWPIVLDRWSDWVSWLSNQHQFESFLITKKSYKVYFLTPYIYHYNVSCKLWIEHFITIYSFSDFELPATISPFNMFYRFQKKKKNELLDTSYILVLSELTPFSEN